MTGTEFSEYLRKNAKVVPVLRAALLEEEKHKADAHYLGWEWSEVHAFPATLMKLVVDRLIRVNYKSQRYTNYLLEDSVREMMMGIKV